MRDKGGVYCLSDELSSLEFEGNTLDEGPEGGCGAVGDTVTVCDDGVTTAERGERRKGCF